MYVLNTVRQELMGRSRTLSREICVNSQLRILSRRTASD
nr:MAG TPA: hypothetical protein [Caudoviricetes sp.]